MSRNLRLYIFILLGIYGHSAMSQHFTEKEWIYLPNHTEGNSFPMTLRFANDSISLYSFGSDKVFSIGCRPSYVNCIIDRDTILINQKGDRLLMKWNGEDFNFEPLDPIIQQVQIPSKISMESLKNQTFTYGSEELQIVFTDTLFDDGIVGTEYRDYIKSYFLFKKGNNALALYDDGIWGVHETKGLKTLILQGMFIGDDWYFINGSDSTGLQLSTSDEIGLSKVDFRKIPKSEPINLGMLQDSKWLLSDYQEFKDDLGSISSFLKEPNSPAPLSFSDLARSSIELQFSNKGRYEVKRDSKLLDFGSWLTVSGHSDLIQIITRNDFQVGGIQYCRFIDIQSLTQRELKIYTEVGVGNENGIDHIPMLLTFKKR